MTRAERAQLERVLDAATQARQALDLFELDQESGIPTALLAAPLDRVVAGLRAVLGIREGDDDHPS